MQSLENSNNRASSSRRPLFSPLVVNPLRTQGNLHFPDGSAFYNQKHNMIITNTDDHTIQFYDATTLLPLKGREPKKLDSLIADFSYHQETDTYLLSCEGGYIYSYNASRHELKQLKEFEEYVIAIEFVSSSFYVFSIIERQEFYLGILNSNKIFPIRSKNRNSYCFHHLAQKKLLFVSLDNGTVIIYRTDNLPKMPIFCSISAHKVSHAVVRIQSGILNGKEIVMTATKDMKIKIWQITRGTMRLLRVIQIKERTGGFVYLESYKMIAMICGSNSIQFWSITSGKLEKALDMDKNERYVLFLMKDKNTVGVPRCRTNLIEFIQLYSRGDR